MQKLRYMTVCLRELCDVEEGQRLITYTRKMDGR